MIIGATRYAQVLAICAFAIRCVLGQNAQSGCNANGPRIACGESHMRNISMWVCRRQYWYQEIIADSEEYLLALLHMPYVRPDRLSLEMSIAKG